LLCDREEGSKEDIMSRRTARYAITTFVLALAAVSIGKADHRHRGEDPLLTLSHKIERSARQVRHAAYDSHYWNPFRDHAIRQVRWLEREARDFRRDLERYGPYSRRVRRDFEELKRAYYHARRASPALRLDRRAYDEFRSIEYRMDRLSREFETRLVYYDRHDRRRGHGHAKHRDRGRRDDEYYDGYRRSARYSD
jgi:hypothetical protein